MGVGRGVLLGAALALLPSSVMAQDFEYRGYVESDLRGSLPGKGIEDLEGEDTLEFMRSDNTASARFCYGNCNSLEGAMGIADIKLVMTGIWYDSLHDSPYASGELWNSLWDRSVLDPLRIESDELMVVFKNTIGDNMSLDFAMGRQQVIWGTADQFNPTSNLNSYDFEDPIKFGEALANEMISASFEWMSFEEDPIVERISVQAVVVPMFRPDQLPRSAQFVFKDPTLFAAFANSPGLDSLVRVQDFFLNPTDANGAALEGGAVTYNDIQVKAPDFGFENMQAGIKYEMTMGGVDMMLSYYHGFDHAPQPTQVDITGLPNGFSIDLSDPDRIITSLRELERLVPGTIASINADTSVVLEFPEVDVVGVAFSTSIESIEGLGFWGEAAATFHEPLELEINAGTSQLIDKDDTDFFIKVAAGFDFSITEWWYINVQYLYGFVDEFAQRNLSHYIVAGSDFMFDSQRFMFRIFGIVNPELDPDDVSAVLYPNFFFKYWNSFDISVGGFIYIGDRNTKFGSPVTGASNVFIKGRYNF